VRPAVQQKFVDGYRAAGGECQYEVFAGCEHLWIREPGPQTDRAYETVKAFIARQLRALRRAA
jgi:alpha-beta hydrolase superfamily lysophospholipase